MTIQRIEVPYLLALHCVSVYEVDGARYLDPLWAHDLRQHVEYISDLTLFCYLERPQAELAELTRIDDCPLLSKVKLVCVPKPRNTIHALQMLPKTAQALWAATRGVTVVHSAVAGWPIPTAWVLLPMQAVRKFVSVILVESADWRSLKGKNSLPRRLWRAVTERVNVLCVRCAHVPVFTHEGYRLSMLGTKAGRGTVIPASWINASDVLDDAAAAQLAEARMAGVHLRLVYAGRLTEDKGIRWLVQALAQQRCSGIPIQLDVFGAGPLEPWLRGAETERPDLRIRFMGTVAYGDRFFSILRQYDALVLPTLTHEQPRILFDAYSQALPVIASASEGTRDYLLDGQHGTAFGMGDEMELQDALRRFADLRPRWGELARNCLSSARCMTHREMHRARAEVINAALQRRTSTPRLQRSRT